MNKNHADVIGRLAADPVLTPENTETGTDARCDFRLIINRKKSGFDVIPVRTWGKLADACAKYLKKGREVNAIGEMRPYSTKSTNAQGETTYKNGFNVQAYYVDFGHKPNKTQQVETEETATEEQTTALEVEAKVTTATASLELPF